MLYLIPLIFSVICIILYDYKHYKCGYKLTYSLICIYCILISGLSYRLGLDIVNFYMDEFEQYPEVQELSYKYLFGTEGRQPGWLLFASICKTVIPSFHFMKFIIAIILNISIFSTIYKNTKLVFTGCCIYMLLLFFYFNFEILRESLAISIFFFAFEYLKKEKWRKYYLLIGAAFLFHESSIFLIFLPLIKKIPINKRSTYTYICVALFTMLFSDLFAWIPQLISSIPFFSEKATHYINSSYFGTMRDFSINELFGYIMSVYLPIFMIYIYKKSNTSFKFGPLIIVYIFISIFMSVFPIMQRLLNYLSIFYYIFYIELIRLFIYKFVGKKTMLLQTLFCSIYIIYTFSNSYLKPTERFLGFPQIVVYYPYASIIDNEIDGTREIFYNLFFRRNI